MSALYVITLAEITDSARSFVIPIGSRVKILKMCEPDDDAVLIEWDRRVVVSCIDELQAPENEDDADTFCVCCEGPCDPQAPDGRCDECVQGLAQADAELESHNHD